MEEILEAVLELILEGSEEVVKSRKVHTILRVLAGVLLGLFYGGCLVISCVLMAAGIQDGNIPICLIGLLCFGFFTYGGYSLLRKIHKNNTKR